MKKLALIAYVVVLSGCAVKFDPTVGIRKTIDIPPVGEVAIARIGDPMLQKGEIVEEEVIILHTPVRGIAYDIRSGSYPQFGEWNGEKFYEPTGVIRSALADPYMAISTRHQRPGQVCVVTTFGARSCYDAAFETKIQVSSRAAAFQQTLVYSGRVGDRIRAGYREFSNNMARPAFNNEVEYDLSSSSIIGYKGASIEILKADNLSITYRVISTFRDPM